MTQVVLFNSRQTTDKSSFLVESEAKNPLLTINKKPWTDFAGLSWIFLDDPLVFDK